MLCLIGYRKNKKYKISIILLFFLFCGVLKAQSPSLINYQGIVRDDKGQAVVNQVIAIKFEILLGSASGTVIYTDNQSTGVSTNNFGLFTTQIGKNGGMDQLDWQQNQSYFLKVSIDPTGGTNLVEVGAAQPFASVPFALHAKTIPVTYSNSILSIGGKTFDITPSITTVPNTSLTVSGLGTVTSVGTNTFDINIPAPTFSNTGQTIISGTYPDFVVNTPTVPSAITPSITVTNTSASSPSVQSSGSSFSINIPTTTFSNTSQNIITGSFPNFIVNTPTIPATPTVSAIGMATVSSGPNYVVGVPAPTLNIASGSISISGGNSVALPSAPTVSAAGIATVSSGPNYIVGVQSPSFTNSGQTIISGTYPNYSVNTPTVATPTIVVTSTAAAGPSVSSTGSFFNINVPPLNGWSTTGNAGTNASTNFIGTTDNNALTIKVNNVQSGRIDQSLFNTSLGYQSMNSSPTGSFNTGIGSRALTTTGGTNRNTAVGSDALSSSLSGDDNTAVGYSALMQSTTGSMNTAFGSSAMALRTGGAQNVAIGANALRSNLTGNFNTALGFQAGNNNTGTANVFLGYLAGNNNTGSSNVFLGYQAGANYLGSNKLLIANSSTTVAPLIYGDFANNFVGIGTTNANASLQFDNTISGRKVVLWEGVNNDHQVYGFGLSTNTLRYQVDDAVADHAFFAGINSTSSQELMRIKGTGNVGIGTSSPSFKLDIVGTGGPRLRVFSQDGMFAGLLAKNNTHEYFIGVQADYESAGGVNSGFHIYDNTVGARRMVIDDIGRMGINQSAPTATLHVNGTTRLVDGTQGLGKVLTSDAQGNASWQTNSGWSTGGNTGTSAGTNFIGTTDAQDVVIKSNNNEVFRATTAGNYVLTPSNTALANVTQTIYTPAKTTNINGNLLMLKGGNAGTGAQARSGGNVIIEGGDGWHINSFSYLMGGVVLRTGKNLGVGSGNQNGGVISFENHNGSNTLYEMARFDISGNFGLGVTSPAYQLELSQNSAGKPTSNVWTTTSDARLKTNVHPYQDGLKELMKINPVWFTYTGEANMPKETGVGVIAQDLQIIAPYMIKEWIYKSNADAPGTSYLGVDNGPMTYMLINAVKEQQQQIEELENEIIELKQKFNELLNK